MNTMLNAANIAGAIAMGAFALGGLAAPAMAEEARIRVGDLNLDTPQGRAEFDGRVKATAERMCWSYRELARHRTCVNAYREEAYENLAEQQARLARQQGASR